MYRSTSKIVKEKFNLGSDSYVLRLIGSLAEYLLNVLHGSSTYRILKSVAGWFGKCFGGSRAIAVLKRGGMVDRLWDKSKTYKLFSHMLHSPTIAFKKRYAKKQHIF
jgi:hypothetical protein